ncbi:MAG: GTPase HflX, partial [Staphylococcus carnosus]
VRALLIEQVEKQMEPYTEKVPADDADRLYFLKRHTIINQLDFNEEDESYTVEGYRQKTNDEGKKQD